MRPPFLLRTCLTLAGSLLLLQSPAWSEPSATIREEAVRQIQRERVEQMRRRFPATAPAPARPAPTATPQLFQGQGYGYSKENPVKLGSPDLFEGAAMSQVYLRRLRDQNNQPLQFERIGNVGPNEEQHIVDLYRLIDASGTEYRIYIDMYHPDLNPLTLQAPEGLQVTP